MARFQYVAILLLALVAIFAVPCSGAGVRCPKLHCKNPRGVQSGGFLVSLHLFSDALLQLVGNGADTDILNLWFDRLQGPLKPLSKYRK